MNDIQSRVSAELSKTIDDTPEGIKQAVIGLEALRLPLMIARVNAQCTLAEKRGQFRHPKDKEFTDFDRTIMLESDIAQYSKSFQELSGLEGLVSDRILFLRQLLNS
jgi:hypothetical protein